VLKYFCGKKMNCVVDALPASVRTNANVDRVGAFIRQDRRLAIRMIANELNVPQIVTQDLKTRKVCAVMVPKKNQNDVQKARRSEVLAEKLELLEAEPNVLNLYETWYVYHGT
jgi:hypothetical protein